MTAQKAACTRIPHSKHLAGVRRSVCSGGVGWGGGGGCQNGQKITNI